MSIFCSVRQHEFSPRREYGEPLTLALKSGCDVIVLHAVSTSMFFSLFSVLGKVAPWHIIMGPSGPAGALNAWVRGSVSCGGGGGGANIELPSA